MEYQEAVAAAAGALQRGDAADWELARLTYDYTRTGAGHPGPVGPVTMAQWCADVRARSGRRFSTRTGRLFKAAWQWRLDNSANSAALPVLNEVLRELQPERYDPVVVQARVDVAAVEKLLSAGTPEAKREVFDRLRADPEVVPPAFTVASVSPDGEAAEALPTAGLRPEPVAVAKGALRLAMFVLDARVAAQHYAQALSDAELDAAGREAEAAAVDTVLRAWQRLRFIVDAPGGMRLVREVEDFLADARV